MLGWIGLQVSFFSPWQSKDYAQQPYKSLWGRQKANIGMQQLWSLLFWVT